MERNDQAAKDKVMELIKDMPIAMLSTRGPDGKFHSRPMATSDTAFDGKLFFLTDIESGKTHDLATDAETLVTYADHSANRYVALRGHGSISQDKAEISERLNALVARDAAVTDRWISDQELDANPGLVKTMSVKPPRGSGRVRLVEIEGIDLQPCGGTHVRRTGEIGRVVVTDIEKKGKQNRRVRIRLGSAGPAA